jgi:hypothetical protein
MYDPDDVKDPLAQTIKDEIVAAGIASQIRVLRSTVTTTCIGKAEQDVEGFRHLTDCASGEILASGLFCEVEPNLIQVRVGILT